MASITILSVWLSALAVLPGTSSLKDDFSIYWQDKKYTPQRLPAELGEATRAHIDRWGAWGARAGFALHVGPSQRVLMFSSKTQNRAKKAARLAGEALASFDEWVLLRGAGTDAPTSDSDRGGGDPILLFDLVTEDEARDVLAILTHGDERLAAWAGSGAGRTGFVVAERLAAGWVEKGTDNDGWRSDNELVHRLTLCLVQRHFGVQPSWLAQGIAWHAESALLQKIFCSAGGFLGSLEHSDWDKPLRSEFRRRKEQPLELAECADLDGTSSEGGAAYKAWGIASYFAQHRAGQLSSILEDLRLHYDQNRRVTRPDGSWELIPGYTIPIDEQLGIFERHAGEGFLEEVSEFFRKGRSYSPPKGP